ncbi:hypothetical protein D1224_16295 [Henriciella barbarensis]|uniref:DUF5681 domain-containing protein n=2 Tax=Henriciella barbarensis TaxID=86342 RepID=A0A399QP71_9PROT|nr:hypothetical protein D1224_16295 [Henriciella barbarensis]
MGSLEELLKSKVTITENGKTREITLEEALPRRIVKDALDGKPHAQKRVFDWAAQEMERRRAAAEDLFETAIKIKAAITKYENDRSKYGDNYVFPILSAEQIKIDYEAGTVEVNGPLNAEQFQTWLGMIAQMVRCEVDIQEAEFEGLDDEDSDIADQRWFLAKLRELIPTTDPMWREFAPKYRQVIIDERFYYAEDGDLPTALVDLTEKQLKAIFENRPRPTRGSLRELSRRKAENKKFRAFMRTKLKKQMGKKWETRLDKEVHEPRDVELDFIRYKNEIGQFDADDYEFSDEEKEALKDPEFFKAYMSWDKAA